MDPAKVKEIVVWSTPTTVTEIRSLLGLAGYYWRFIEGFSKIAKPMTSLLEKGREFKWDEKCQDSFDQLIKRLMSPPVLVMPDLQKGFDMIRPSDMPKMDFSTRYGLYEFIVMSFGQTNAPTYFMNLMNKVFMEYLDRFVVVFIDDNIIYSKSESDHEEHLIFVLQKL